jgi:hypothetical protein
VRIAVVFLRLKIKCGAYCDDNTVDNAGSRGFWVTLDVVDASGHFGPETKLYLKVPVICVEPTQVRRQHST